MIQLEQNPEALIVPLPVFASEPYLRSRSEDCGWFVDTGFVLPFYLLKRGVFNSVVFSTGSIRTDVGATAVEERAFLLDVVAEVRRMDVDFIAQPQTNALFDVYPEGSQHIEFGSYRVGLGASVGELFARFHPNHRNVVRKANRDGVLIRNGAEFVGECHALIQRTMARQCRPCIGLGQLQSYRHNLGDQVAFYLAEHEGELQGCAVLIWDESSCYYVQGGSRERPHNGAMTLLHWTAMQDMKARGVATYDFVGGRIKPVAGSKQESIQRFKSRFGTTMARGYLWKYPLRRWKYTALLASRRFRDLAKRRGYSEDIIDNEIRNARRRGSDR